MGAGEGLVEMFSFEMTSSMTLFGERGGAETTSKGSRSEDLDMDVEIHGERWKVMRNDGKVENVGKPSQNTGSREKKKISPLGTTLEENFAKKIENFFLRFLGIFANLDHFCVVWTHVCTLTTTSNSLRGSEAAKMAKLKISIYRAKGCSNCPQ